MKMRKLLKYKFILAVVALFFTGCRPDIDVEPVSPDSPKDALELKSALDFDWSLVRKVKVEIVGIPTDLPVRRLLVLKNEEGLVVYQGLYNMSDKMVVEVVIPTVQQKLSAAFGSIHADLPIQRNQARFMLCADCQ